MIIIQHRWEGGDEGGRSFMSQVESSSSSLYVAIVILLLLLLLPHYSIHYRTTLLQYAWAYRDNGYHTITWREVRGAWTRIVGDSDTLLRKSRYLSPICYDVEMSESNNQYIE